MPVKINVKNCLVYIIFAACCVLLNGAVKGVPLSLSLYFPLLICGGNAIAAPIIYIACSLIHLNLISFLCSLFEAGFLLAITLIYRRTQRKISFEAAVYMCVALAPYVIFGEWQGVEIEALGSGYLIKGIAAAVVLLFFIFGYRAVYALIFRIGRCLLKEDELVCIAAMYAAIGTGAVNFTGEFVYLAVSSLLTALSARFFKSPSALIFAAVISIPVIVVNLTITPLTAYVIICITSLVFCRAGRAASPLATSAAACAYAYFADFFDDNIVNIVLKAVILVVTTTLATIPSDGYLKKLKEKLMIKKELADTAVNRERERTGEKLFKISQAFREIECAFSSMDEAADDGSAKKRIFTELCRKCCTGCERLEKCEKATVYSGLTRLIEAGTAKGKVNLIDLPPDVTQNCFKPGEIITQLNILLIEYRRYMLEAENVHSGRVLLAEQAEGVSKVLKNCAVDLCKRTESTSGDEKRIRDKLASCGISCPELMINSDTQEVCAVIVGKVNIKTVTRAIEQVLCAPCQLKDKICCDKEKCCYIFCRPPRLDAVFGVASIRKDGESASGDTHSVIRINERKFLMALSDGMGSGEYARKVSRTAISLIEAFYRAEMPEGTVLDTINKLISFSRDERFACIDIGAVDLDTGCAELIKIGSPVAVIMRAGEIKIVESQSLPLGILDNLRPSVAREQLKDGDFLIFMSDGVTGAFSSTPELAEFLQPLKPLNPQSLADAILDGAVRRTGGAALDDMTVLCTRIFTHPAYMENDKKTA